MPNSNIGQQQRFRGVHFVLPLHRFRNVTDIILSDHLQQRLNIFGTPAQPILKRHHERPGIGRFVTGQKFQHLRQSPQQFEHAFFKTGTIFLFFLFHKIGYHRLGLTEILHGKRTDLVQPHHFRHGRKNQAGIEILFPGGCDHFDDFLGQFLDKNQRPNENVGIIDIQLELFVRIIIAQFLQEIADTFNRHIGIGGIDPFHGGRH
mmetsp:Transcript_23840/g.27248  ORF Transcript_23840/g.27248 Transcript_23840/m.27248 type:complete len:205 (-) Transcript_23840:576-1190(-)